MSPEQVRGEGEVDHRSDLWSLAIIAVECLTGKRPFEANGIAPLLLQVVDQAPPALAELGHICHRRWRPGGSGRWRKIRSGAFRRRRSWSQR
jgi:serine/threonine protein kinase